MLNIKIFVFSPFQENTYVVWDNENNSAAIIDPGCLEQPEEKMLSDYIADNSLIIKYLINTHCHIDHIFGNAYIKLKYDCEFLAPGKDAFLIDMMHEQADMFGLNVKLSPKPDCLISNELSITLGGSSLNFLFTPGHTPGEYSIYSKGNNFCITGDVLFKEGIGRTDLWGGDFDTLINSIKIKLMTLPDDTIIYPGHGEKSTIGYERTNNSFLG